MQAAEDEKGRREERGEDDMKRIDAAQVAKQSLRHSPTMEVFLFHMNLFLAANSIVPITFLVLQSRGGKKGEMQRVRVLPSVHPSAIDGRAGGAASATLMSLLCLGRHA